MYTDIIFVTRNQRRVFYKLLELCSKCGKQKKGKGYAGITSPAYIDSLKGSEMNPSVIITKEFYAKNHFENSWERVSETEDKKSWICKSKHIHGYSDNPDNIGNLPD